VQTRTGVRVAPWGSAQVAAAIPPVAAQFLADRQMIVLGAAADDGSVWASLLAGPAGFVTAKDERTVVVDRLPGDLDPLAGFFEAERDVGMLAIDTETRRRMRVNGRAQRDGDRLVVHTQQVYANCPKYIQTREPMPAEPTAARARHGGRLTADQQQLIRGADTFFIATHAAGLGADVSHRGGRAGFVSLQGDRRLSWPDYAGNYMYMTLGNLDLDPRCGLLFLDWERGRALHLSGRARIDWDAERAATVPGAQRMIDLDVDEVLDVEEAVPLRWAFGDYSRFNPS
jgi:predicted pyridoxine 5'-phosphate oxidase superfamily flavin-nucleotide-binding protein